MGAVVYQHGQQREDIRLIYCGSHRRPVSRFLVAFAVIAVHALATVLIITTVHQERSSHLTQERITSAFLLGASPSPVQTTPVLKAPQLITEPPLTVPPIVRLRLPPLVTEPETRPAIDWAAAAQRAAATAVAHRGPTLGSDQNSAVAPGLPWWQRSPEDSEPPEHHRGESYTTATGQQAVWVSDHCYLLMPLSGPPSSISHTQVPQWHCNGQPDRVLGDLLEKLKSRKDLEPFNAGAP